MTICRSVLAHRHRASQDLFQPVHLFLVIDAITLLLRSSS
jgi:hypothetical protein